MQTSPQVRRNVGRCYAVKTEANLFARISRVLKSYANSIGTGSGDTAAFRKDTQFPANLC